MKKALLTITALLLVQISQAQVDTAQKAKEVYNKDFKWKIEVPASFNNVSPEQYAQLQQKGAAAIESVYNGKKVENNTHLIFAFKSDKFHYFESNYQPYDTAKDGDFLVMCKGVDNILYGTFKKQVPEGTKIDTTQSTEVIDNLTFQKFEMKISINGLVLDLLMYNRLFDKKDFTVTIFYVDKKKGEELLAAWRGSKFDKN